MDHLYIWILSILFVVTAWKRAASIFFKMSSVVYFRIMMTELYFYMSYSFKITKEGQLFSEWEKVPLLKLCNLNSVLTQGNNPREVSFFSFSFFWTKTNNTGGKVPRATGQWLMWLLRSFKNTHVQYLTHPEGVTNWTPWCSW